MPISLPWTPDDLVRTEQARDLHVERIAGFDHA
jgi:hypothetical protein